MILWVLSGLAIATERGIQSWGLCPGELCPVTLQNVAQVCPDQIHQTTGQSSPCHLAILLTYIPYSVTQNADEVMTSYDIMTSAIK